MATYILYGNGALIRSRHIKIAKEFGLHLLHGLKPVSLRRVLCAVCYQCREM